MLVAPVDYKNIEKPQGYNAYQRAEEEFQLKKALAQAQIADTIKKAQEVDADKLGEQAFLRAAQNLPLNAREQAALKYIDAKSGGIMFDPVTGSIAQKPSILERAGVGFGGIGQPQPAPISPPKSTIPKAPSYSTPEADAAISEVFNAGREPYTPSKEVVLTRPDVTSPSTYGNVFEKNYKIEREKAIAAGDRKRLQDIDTAYAKSKLEMNESESKAAGFADRALISNKIISGVESSGLDPYQEAVSKIPFVGNYVISGDKQSLNQAQRDFINAILRRESGAVIADSEFDNARKQYFPVPGDTAETLAQKAQNRKEAARGIARSAGAAYQEPAFEPVKKTGKDSLQVEFEAKKLGGKLIGTQKGTGKRIFQLPDGSHVMEQ